MNIKKMKYDEDIVVEGLRNSCPKAYQMMVTRFSPSMMVMVYSFTSNRHDAESLVTHTFEDAYLNIDKYEPVCKFSTWLFSIGKHNCIDYLRGKRITPWDEETEKIYIETKRNGRTPEEIFIKNQQIELAYRFLAKLKPEVRKYVEDFYINELSYNEIAEKYKTTSAAARTIVHRARVRLRKSLTKNTER